MPRRIVIGPDGGSHARGHRFRFHVTDKPVGVSRAAVAIVIQPCHLPFGRVIDPHRAGAVRGNLQGGVAGRIKLRPGHLLPLAVAGNKADRGRFGQLKLGRLLRKLRPDLGVILRFMLTYAVVLLYRF
ncbi:hypothetical protein Xsto_04186 [Xenorhabdus stockiae]|uniref:Uncharacterized protein n=1 Tax=Xenorhabdus stockiae TaxID=351614 RepID=A0A2D0JYY1_9GAMM|nr:hypothetical protein Xsto_04186 [Xenorhabdus stockiae]